MAKKNIKIIVEETLELFEESRLRAQFFFT